MLKSCPGARTIKEIWPEYVPCPRCQSEVEIWSDEYRARCVGCNVWVYRKQGPTCLDWCPEAERCVGSAAMAAYERARNSTQ